MAFAPHTNNDVHALLLMNGGTTHPMIFGRFRADVSGPVFEYAERRHPDDSFAPEMPHIIYCGPNAFKPETRLAKVLKTVAYVVVDEDENGPVIEKWHLRDHKVYDTQWVGREEMGA